MEFNKCLCSTQRLMKYTEGSRNSFLFTLGNKCFRKGLEESEVKRLAAERLGDGGGMDTDTPIGNAYTYTDRTERAEEKKKIPLVEQVIDYLNKNYAFRRNTVLDRLEMCDLSQTEEKSFYAMRNKDFNSIFLNISRQGIAYPLNSLKSVIDSDYSPEFNPFTPTSKEMPGGTGRLTTSENWRTPYRRKIRSSGGRDSGGGSWPWWPRPSDRAKQTKKHWCCTEHREKEKVPG